MVDHSRELEAQAFPERSCRLHKNIVAIQSSLDDLALKRAEARFVELTTQCEVEIRENN
jgi:hypothetical protein